MGTPLPVPRRPVLQNAPKLTPPLSISPRSPTQKLLIDSVAQGTFLETSFDDHSFFSKEVDLDETEPMYESVHFSDYSGPNVM